MILGLHLAAGDYGIALLNSDGTPCRELRWKASHSDGERIHEIIQQELENAGRVWSDLTCVGCTTGPGGYTGLRLGILTAKTIAQVQSIPLIPIGTLHAIALHYQYDKRMIMTVIPAIKGEVNAGLYSVNSGKVDEVLAPITWTYAHFKRMIEDIQEPIVVGGPLTPEIMQLIHSGNTTKHYVNNHAISPVVIAEYARQHASRSNSLHAIHPTYSHTP